MLILTRRPNEAIKVGQEITITVLGVVGNQVRFGIEAPREIPVHREEIYDRIEREKAKEEARSNGTLAEPNGNLAEPNGNLAHPRAPKRVGGKS